MGNCATQQHLIQDDLYADDKVTDMIKQQAKLGKVYKIPVEVQVSHFTPSSFPLIPIITSKSSRHCSDSWKRITLDVKDENGNDLSGITAFYNEFYERLGKYDSSGRFEAVLTRNSSGQNKIAAKGAILVRIISFAIKIEKDSKETQAMLHMLGKSHAQKQIRPWQYAVFVETLLLTISSRLGIHATNDVMESWVNLFAFILKTMLPPAIKDAVEPTELNINTSTSFHDEKTKRQVLDVIEEGSQKEQTQTQTQKIGNKASMSSMSNTSMTDRVSVSIMYDNSNKISINGINGSNDQIRPATSASSIPRVASSNRVFPHTS